MTVITESDLLEVCVGCIGTGENRDSDPCDKCSGYGHHLTSSGLAILSLLRTLGIPIPMSPKAEAELRGMAEP